MNKRVYDLLITVATKTPPWKDGIVFYQQVNLLCRLGLDFSRDRDRVVIGETLGEISMYEHEQGRPLLSGIVVQQETGIPADRFFKLAKGLGVIMPGRDRDEAYFRYLKEIHAFWAKK